MTETTERIQTDKSGTVVNVADLKAVIQEEVQRALEQNTVIEQQFCPTETFFRGRARGRDRYTSSRLGLWMRGRNRGISARRGHGSATSFTALPLTHIEPQRPICGFCDRRGHTEIQCHHRRWARKEHLKRTAL